MGKKWNDMKKKHHINGYNNNNKPLDFFGFNPKGYPSVQITNFRWKTDHFLWFCYIYRYTLFVYTYKLYVGLGNGYKYYIYLYTYNGCEIILLRGLRAPEIIFWSLIILNGICYWRKQQCFICYFFCIKVYLKSKFKI